ncbi:SRPBCC family protein [Paracoccus spongiarum]|uniref:SRPBCC family protein n=1 Tax=Paracoccus spongiarum TaxID=3064387 RepID=A0ABT9JBN6_9RHOB|nr:SRPBCC family protein [Paracoccus sp. 2205BS29-5]MDP5307225.1 SRPBCC family protein [Paracoccus sp. 2205BS29-5]
MKFSTRFDVDSTADDLFAAISDFNRLERVLRRRGTSVSRVAPDAGPVGWLIGFDWRGRPRKLRLEVTRSDPPEHLTMAGTSEALDVAIEASVVALSPSRSRLIFETTLRPRNMRARLMLQTAKLAKPQLDRKYDRRIAEFLDHMRARA